MYVAQTVIPSDKAVVTQTPPSLMPSSLALEEWVPSTVILNTDSVWHSVYFKKRSITQRWLQWDLSSLRVPCLELCELWRISWLVTESWNAPSTCSSSQLTVQSTDKSACALLTGNLEDDTWWTNLTVQREQQACVKIKKAAREEKSGSEFWTSGNIFILISVSEIQHIPWPLSFWSRNLNKPT